MYIQVLTISFTAEKKFKAMSIEYLNLPLVTSVNGAVLVQMSDYLKPSLRKCKRQSADVEDRNAGDGEEDFDSAQNDPEAYTTDKSQAALEQ